MAVKVVPVARFRQPRSLSRHRRRMLVDISTVAVLCSSIAAAVDVTY